MKKMLLALLVLCLSFGFSGNVFAASTDSDPTGENQDITWEVIEGSLENGYVASELFGLTTENLFPEYSLFGVSRPSSVWDISKKGQYDFAGSSKSQTLYSNYSFKGKTSYTVKINNTGSNPITVKAKRLTKTYASTKVSGGKSATIQFSNIEKTTEFYVTFDGTYISFNGYVK